MKIHLQPPLPPTPPAIPPKPPTRFELEQHAEELIATAKQQRLRREQLSRLWRKRGPLQEDSGSDGAERDKGAGPDTFDVLI